MWYRKKIPQMAQFDSSAVKKNTENRKARPQLAGLSKFLKAIA